MSSYDNKKVYISIHWTRKHEETHQNIFSIKDDFKSKLKGIFTEPNLTWVDSGDAYDIENAIKKLATIMERGDFTKEIFPPELTGGGEYLFPISFWLEPVCIHEL
jgi:hypothetical protein